MRSKAPNIWYKEKRKKLEKDPEFIAEKIKLELTERICEVMEEKGLNKVDLAERLGVTRAYVTRLLNGSANLTIDTIVKIAVVLDASLQIELLSSKKKGRKKYARPHSVPTYVNEPEE